MTSAPVSGPLREMDSLTRRQREVLALAAKGMTNPEIGDHLGISKDGAKWHIGEILMRLNVDTREEAVDLWKRYNGLPYRLHRVMRAVLGPVAVRWVLGGVAATAVAGLAVVLVVLATQGGDSPKADVTPPATTASATAAPSPTPQTIDGIPVVGAHVGEAAMLPAGTVLYMASGCTSCDAPARSIDRVIVGAEGAVSHSTVYAVPDVKDTGESPSGQYISSVATSLGGYGLVVGVCTRGYCGQVGNMTADAATTYYGSHDGGITWNAIGTIAGGGSVLAVVTVGATTTTALVQQLLPKPGGGTDAAYFVLPGDNPATVYQASGGSTWVQSAGTNYQLVLASDGKSVVDALNVGSALMPDLPTGANILGAWHSPQGLMVAWNMRQADRYVSYLGSMGLDSKREPRATGKPESAIGWTDVGLQVFNGAFLDPGHAIVTVGMTDAQSGVTSVLGHISEPAIVNLQTGALQPISGYFLDRAKSGDRSNVLAVSTGAFAQVQGAGDCLNVRATASTNAASLGCYKDGVLLRLGGTTLDAGGRKWLAVSTPLNGSGWAAAEFLSPLAAPPRDGTSYPASTRTGNADIDPVLAAIESGDGQQIVAATAFSKVACADHPEGIGAPPKCPPGVSEGTSIDVIGISACEGAMVPRADYEANPNVPGVGMPLYTIFHATTSQAWQYTIMFTNPTNGLAAALHVTDGKITGISNGCSDTPPEWLANQPHGDFILPPKTP